MGQHLDYNNETKVRETFHAAQDGRHIIEATQDCDDIIAYNDSLRGNLNKKSDWWQVGSIPLAVCQKWAHESSTKVFNKEWQAYAKKQLNDSDYSKLNPNNIKI